MICSNVEMARSSTAVCAAPAARVVDEDVELAEAVDRRSNGEVDLPAVGDIHLHRECLASKRLELVDEVAVVLHVSQAHHDVCAGLAEGHCDRVSEPARRARDEGHSAREIEAFRRHPRAQPATRSRKPS